MNWPRASMIRISRLWREPLVHFLAIGAGLFLVFDLTQPPAGDASNRIAVSAGQVEQIAAQFSRTWMRPPTEAELTGLIDNYVRDEVYFREAVALGLDAGDQLIRRRMRQKLEFLLEDLSAENAPSDEVLTAFLQQHGDRFRIEPQISLRHVYLNPDQRRDLDADAANMLAALRSGISAEALGDPILWGYEFDAATQSEVARLFGARFAEQVVALEPGAWSGPIDSGLGAHLVLVTDRREGRLPRLSEVRAQVERDWLAQRRRELKDMAYRKLREGYEVVIERSSESGGTADTAMVATGSETAAR